MEMIEQALRRGEKLNLAGITWKMVRGTPQNTRFQIGWFLSGNYVPKNTDFKFIFLWKNYGVMTNIINMWYAEYPGVDFFEVVEYLGVDSHQYLIGRNFHVVRLPSKDQALLFKLMYG